MRDLRQGRESGLCLSLGQSVAYSSLKYIIEISPDSNGTTEVKGEKGRASCRVNGRENRGGCAEGLNPFCAPLRLSGC